MKLTIVTPERKTFEGEVDQVTIPTAQGQITVLPQHTPLVTQLEPGELAIKGQNRQFNLVVGFGFAEISGRQVAILTDLAEEAAEISEKEADEARRRAEEALKEKERLSAEEYAAVAAALEKSLVRLRVKRRHAKRHSQTWQSGER